MGNGEVYNSGRGGPNTGRLVEGSEFFEDSCVCIFQGVGICKTVSTLCQGRRGVLRLTYHYLDPVMQFMLLVTSLLQIRARLPHCE